MNNPFFARTIAKFAPAGDLSWLEDRIVDLIIQGDYDYIDNARLAIKGHSPSELVYEHAQDNGCCGFVDVELGPAPSGTTYLYGFNHGH